MSYPTPQLVAILRPSCKLEEIRYAGQAARNAGEPRDPPAFLREGSWLWAAWLDGWENPADK